MVTSKKRRLRDDIDFQGFRTAPSRRTTDARVAIAYGFFALGIGINGWNATMGGAITDMAVPAVLGILAAGVVFFLPAWALRLPIGRQVLARALFAFISVFALTNSPRMAIIIAVDQATARADRQTEGIRAADHALDVARTKPDDACGRGLCKTSPARSGRPRSPNLKLANLFRTFLPQVGGIVLALA
jgi:hypothetical protein